MTGTSSARCMRAGKGAGACRRNGCERLGRVGGTSSNGVSSKGCPGLKTTSQLSFEHQSMFPTPLMLIRPFPVKLAKELQNEACLLPAGIRLSSQSEHNLPRPPHDKMPPEPSFTCAILGFRGVQDFGRKGSLSEVVNWISDKHEWYLITGTKNTIGEYALAALRSLVLTTFSDRLLFGTPCRFQRTPA